MLHLTVGFYVLIWCVVVIAEFYSVGSETLGHVVAWSRLSLHPASKA